LVITPYASCVLASTFRLGVGVLSPQPVDEVVHSRGVGRGVMGNGLIGGREIEKAGEVHLTRVTEETLRKPDRVDRLGGDLGSQFDDGCGQSFRFDDLEQNAEGYGLCGVDVASGE
jgi:hypothetical protein